jgi:hypothetical protein
VKRALQQFRSQKWWEKQQEAYTIILEHVSTIQYDAGIECDAIEQGYSRTRGEFLQELTRKAYYEIERFAAQGDYLISPTAAKALQEFQKAINKWSGVDSGDPYETYSERFNAAKECISVITAEAKRTLFEAPHTDD